MQGAIANPGLIEFKNNKSVMYYINSAGGVTSQGDKNKIIVIYANGIIATKKWYRPLLVEDGSTIIVSEKPVEIPFDFTQFVTNWTSITASIVTVVVLARQNP